MIKVKKFTSPCSSCYTFKVVYSAHVYISHAYYFVNVHMFTYKKIAKLQTFTTANTYAIYGLHNMIYYHCLQ